MSSNSGNYLTQRRLAGKKISNTPLYRYNGLVHTIGHRLHGTYLDGKGQGNETVCDVRSEANVTCCGDSGPPYYDANTCNIYYNTFETVPSRSFLGNTYSGYADSEGYGYSSLAVAGGGYITYTVISDCTSCSGSQGAVSSASFVNSASLGYYTMAGIKHKDGTLWTWGSNYIGLGYEVGSNVVSPVQLGSDSYIAIAGGGSGPDTSTGHFAAIKSDGTLWLWGSNLSGQLGDGTTTSRSSPVQVSGGGTWKYVHCGRTQTCAIKSDDTLWVWGSNISGQLGDGTSTNRSSPVQVSGGGTWKMARIDDYNGYGIKTNGTLYGWGFNTYYNVGDGTTISRTSPVQIGSAFSDWKDVQHYGANLGQGSAIRETGHAYAWGRYADGPVYATVLEWQNVPTPTLIPWGTEHSSCPHGWYNGGFYTTQASILPPGSWINEPAYITKDGNVIAYSTTGPLGVSSTKWMIYSGGGAVKAYAPGAPALESIPTSHIIKYIL